MKTPTKLAIARGVNLIKSFAPPQPAKLFVRLQPLLNVLRRCRPRGGGCVALPESGLAIESREYGPPPSQKHLTCSGNGA